METPECNTGVDCSECIGVCDVNLELSDNEKYYFEDMTQWEKDNPGSNDYTCEFCGIYTASKARCNKCEKE